MTPIYNQTTLRKICDENPHFDLTRPENVPVSSTPASFVMHTVQRTGLIQFQNHFKYQNIGDLGPNDILISTHVDEIMSR